MNLSQLKMQLEELDFVKVVSKNGPEITRFIGGVNNNFHFDIVFLQKSICVFIHTHYFEPELNFFNIHKSEEKFVEGFLDSSLSNYEPEFDMTLRDLIIDVV